MSELKFSCSVENADGPTPGRGLLVLVIQYFLGYYVMNSTYSSRCSAVLECMSTRTIPGGHSLCLDTLAHPTHCTSCNNSDTFIVFFQPSMQSTLTHFNICAWPFIQPTLLHFNICFLALHSTNADTLRHLFLALHSTNADCMHFTVCALPLIHHHHFIVCASSFIQH